MVEWQTRTLEGRMKRFVQVQVLSGALATKMHIGAVCIFIFMPCAEAAVHTNPAVKNRHKRRSCAGTLCFRLSKRHADNIIIKF